MSNDEIIKALRSPSLKPSEAKILFERLLPHQRCALLEERALHEYSASAADANTGGVGGTWPVTTTTGPSNNRHGYSYITNTGQSFGGSINFVPFGQGASTSSRAFQLNLGYNGSSRSGKLFNNSATSGNISSSQIFVDGGWGIPSTLYNGGTTINAVFGNGRGASVSVATPATTALVNSNIYIGYGANSFSSGNFLFSTFGCSFNGGAGDFARLDSIINTLKTTLT